jgi:hypothetical protein
MSDTKALAVAALLMAGAVVRIELGKNATLGTAGADTWWLGHLDSIAELLLPSDETREAIEYAQRHRRASLHARDLPTLQPTRLDIGL